MAEIQEIAIPAISLEEGVSLKVEEKRDLPEYSYEMVWKELDASRKKKEATTTVDDLNKK